MVICPTKQIHDLCCSCFDFRMDKKTESRKLWKEVSKDVLERAALFVVAGLFVALGFSGGNTEGGASLGLIAIAAVVGLICLISIIVQIRWANRMVDLYQSEASVSMRVRFQIGERDQFMDGPTPCYAFLRKDEASQEQKISIHPMICGTEIVNMHDGTAKVYFDDKTEKPAVIETRAGTAWVIRKF